MAIVTEGSGDVKLVRDSDYLRVTEGVINQVDSIITDKNNDKKELLFCQAVPTEFGTGVMLVFG